MHWQDRMALTGRHNTNRKCTSRMIKVQHIMNSFYWSLTHLRYDVMIVRSVLWFIASLISLSAIKSYLCVNLPLYILQQEETFSWLVYDSVHSCPWRQTKNISSYKGRLFSSWQWCWLLHSALKRGRITRAQYKSAHCQSSHLQPGWLTQSVCLLSVTQSESRYACVILLDQIRLSATTFLEMFHIHGANVKSMLRLCFYIKHLKNF